MDDTFTMAAGDPGPGSELKEWGPFRLIERVGQGAFGEVFRARDSVLQREVALKLLLIRENDKINAGEAVLREARSLARVRHPNVVPVYGVDRFQGRVGFWSDFIKGRTLSALLAINGPFGPGEVASIGIEICKALGAVHAAGLLHRDIKAGNVMREEGGRILLMDFGLTHEESGTQQFGGTPSYMAPELLDGKPASAASDLYALGALLYHLLTGEYPVDAPGLGELAIAHRSGKKRSVYERRSDLPEQLAHAIDTALEPSPARRYQSAGEMLQALTLVSLSPGARPVDRKPAKSLYAAIAAGALVTLCAAGLIWWRFTPRERAGPSAHLAYRDGQEYLDAYYIPGNIAKAVGAFRKTISLDPHFAPAFGGLCRASFLNYRDTDSAEFLKGTEDSCAEALTLDSDLASVHVTLGMLYTLNGKSDLAAHELNQAVRLDPGNAEAYAARAELYRIQGRTGDVEPAYLKAMDLAPRDWRWPNQLGYFYMIHGHLDEATQQFQKAVRLSPQNGKPWNQLGMAYRRQHKLAEAEKAFSRAVELLPISTHILNLALVLSEEGNLPGAVELYRRALDLNPGEYLTWANLADVYNRMPGENQRARENYLKAIELADRLLTTNSRDALLASRLATYYATLGMPDKSLPLIRQSLALAPEEPEVLYNAGMSYELLHRRDDAILWIGEAIEHKYSIEAVRQSPAMASLIGDSRFTALSRQLTTKR